MPGFVIVLAKCSLCSGKSDLIALKCSEPRKCLVEGFEQGRRRPPFVGPERTSLEERDGPWNIQLSAERLALAGACRFTRSATTSGALLCLLPGLLPHHLARRRCRFCAVAALVRGPACAGSRFAVGGPSWVLLQEPRCSPCPAQRALWQALLRTC